MRALLATYLFDGAVAGASIVSRLTHYSLTMSPRIDELVVVSDCPTNVLGYLVPNGEGSGSAGLPGLRLSRTIGTGTYQLVHLPTGARMTLTDQRRGVFDETRFAVYSRETKDGYRWWTPDVPLAATEQHMLRFNPTPGGGAAAILRALAMRLDARDVAGRWAIGHWFCDPLQRPKPGNVNDFRGRRLVGGGRRWHLQWGGYPYPTDIVGMLLDEAIGLPGVTVAKAGPAYDLHLDGHTLRIQSGAGS
ncbi:hypothetical protein [Verrucosispora sp. NA02020]|uniref:hypothetical protein n=1 Tax=Verrucosispora sp. NA02020 TaxID=2742132 RepID=UPI001591949E|nr:hypothetical protein [Verrucosispora sp. NA02020]QKW12248.1 hypothetical protein HUT12_05190 [Verrucosispora sp. NA02020]